MRRDLRVGCAEAMLAAEAMTAHEFSASVHDLDAAGKPFRFVVRAAWLRGALEGTDAAPGADGELDVRLSKSGTDVVVRGTLRAEIKVPCARCLEPATVPIRESVSALAVPAPAGATARPREDDEADDEKGSEEADLLEYDGETVVLDELVRDEILLAIPMFPLCSEACPGIRPETAPEPDAAPGIDPRLSPLLSLKKSQT